MIFSIYLHKNIYEVLNCYGDLSTVTNRILDACEQGVIDLFDMPKCQQRDGATRCDIDVTSEYYLQLVATFPVNSPRISLRRLLYWFVENEMYDVLEWEVLNDYCSKEVQKTANKVKSIRQEVEKLQKRLQHGELNFAKDVINKLEDLEHMIRYDR